MLHKGILKVAGIHLLVDGWWQYFMWIHPVVRDILEWTNVMASLGNRHRYSYRHMPLTWLKSPFYHLLSRKKVSFDHTIYPTLISSHCLISFVCPPVSCQFPSVPLCFTCVIQACAQGVLEPLPPLPFIYLPLVLTQWMIAVGDSYHPLRKY